ncbi:MAG: O-antigen ligase family protein [Thermovenabulum sp.]|uniref:O-antigen ligase family protein n=1 Tax=Thermovenabulum sp. TaxID=3100335 RepID=UPI003C7E9231
MQKPDKKNDKKNEKKNKNVNQKKNYNTSFSFDKILYFGLLILVFYPPYFRGMFFDKEFLPTHVFTGVLVFLWALSGSFNVKKSGLFKSISDFAALGVVLSYLLSLFVSVNLRFALGELLKYLNYFFAYALTVDLLRSEKEVKGFLWAVILSALGVSIIGMGAAAGMINYNGAFVGGRINSSLQYPNTLAAYLTAAFFIGLGIKTASKNTVENIILSALNYIFLVTFIFTLSRAAWVLFPLFYLIFLLGLSKENKSKGILFFVESFISSLIASIGLGNAISSGKGQGVWAWFFIGLFASIALSYINYYLIYKKSLFIDFKKAVAFALIFVIVIGLSVYLTGGEILPDVIKSRIKQIDPNQLSVQQRLSYYRDALKMIKERPLLGYGGGGWKSAYFAYQSYRYFTTEVHSFFLQLTVETGIIGLLIFLTFFLSLFMSTVKSLKSDALTLEEKAYLWSSFAGAIALLGHSGVDFNLSLGAVSLLLWELLGAARNLSFKGEGEKRQGEAISFSKPVFAIVAVLFILISTTLFTGYNYGQAAVRSLEQGDGAKAIEYFEKAKKYDPLTVSFIADLSQIYEVIGEKQNNSNMLEKSLQLKEKAASLEPYNAKYKLMLGAAYLKRGRLDEGIKVLEEAVKLNPCNIEMWQALSEGYEKVAEVYVMKDDKEKAKGLLEKSKTIPEKIKELNRKAPKNDPAVVKLTATKELALYTYKSEKLLNEMTKENVVKLKEIDDISKVQDYYLDLDEDGKKDW